MVTYPQVINTLEGPALRNINGTGYDILDPSTCIPIKSLSLKDALINGERAKIFCAQCADIMSRQDYDDIASAQERINEIERHFIGREQAALTG